MKCLFPIFVLLVAMQAISTTAHCVTSCKGNYYNDYFCVKSPSCHFIAIQKSKENNVHYISTICQLDHPLKPHENPNSAPATCGIVVELSLSANGAVSQHFFPC